MVLYVHKYPLDRPFCTTRIRPNSKISKKVRLEPAWSSKTWGSHITIAVVGWVGILLNSAWLDAFESYGRLDKVALNISNFNSTWLEIEIWGTEFAFSNLTIIWGILGPTPILMHIWHFSYHHHQYEFYRIPILGHYFWNILCKLSKCKCICNTGIW